MKMQSIALGAAVVLLAGGAAFVAAKAAIPVGVDVPAAPRSAIDRDVLARLDEIDRRLDQLSRRIDDAERLANSARDAVAEDQANRSAHAPGAGSPAPRTGDSAPAPATAPAAGVPGAAAAALSPEELRAANIRSIHETMRTAARTMVPEMLRKLADTTPKAADARRLDARIAAQQTSLALGIRDDDADDLQAVFLRQSERLAAEIGPLVREGLEKSDRTAVAAKFEEIWAGMDREARELLGDARFERFTENVTTMRGLIRQVVTDAPK